MGYGKEEQEKERKRVTERKDVFGIPREYVDDVITKLYIEDYRIGLCGQIDVVIKLKDGTMLPVEIKYTDFVEAYRGRKKQLTAYAMLIESDFGCKVDTGILYFPIQNEQIEVEITEEDKNYVLKDLEKISDLIASEKIPRKVEKKKCEYCEVKRYCV